MNSGSRDKTNEQKDLFREENFMEGEGKRAALQGILVVVQGLAHAGGQKIVKSQEQSVVSQELGVGWRALRAGG